MLDDVSVHYAAAADFAAAERTMLKAFADQLSPQARARLRDAVDVGPFANLRCWDNRINDHDIKNATGELV